MMNKKMICLIAIFAAGFIGSVNAAELDLSAAGVSITDKNSITLENLTVDGQAYNATIELLLDGTYRVTSSQTVDTSHIANYEVTFESTWSSTTHPTNFPSGSAHFSGLVGATHRSTLSIWKLGELASEGMESMAETGSKATLLEEISNAISNGSADQSLSGDGLSTSPSSTTLSFQINRAAPFVTLVSMIAPSPDWFVGVAGLNLLANGIWQDEIIVPLYAYDSGTDSGSIYTSPNSDTQPPAVISRIEETPFLVNGEVPTMGRMIFRRQN